ncbi:MAG: FecR family protein [bacterium]|nr:FecR family protein [bacterium]
MNEKIDWDLIGRYMTGELSDEDRISFNSWLDSDPNNQKIISDLSEIWNTPEIEPPACDIDKMKSEIFAKAGIKKTEKTRTRLLPAFQGMRPYGILRYAAVFLVFIISAYFIADSFIFQGQSGYENLNRVIVGNTLQEKVVLPDGSTVILDAGSEFSYPDEFNRGEREVFLKGEAYFEVTQDNNTPFIVNAGNAFVKVLGTKFNVRAWNVTESVEVVVSEGNVLFSSMEEPEEYAVVVNKNQLSVLAVDRKPTTPENVDIENYTSWLNNIKKFNNSQLTEVISQLERWYDLKFSIANKELLSVSITIQINKDEPVKDYLELISSIINVSYEISDGTVMFKESRFN